MGNIEAAAPGHQKLAAHAWHAVVDRDFDPAMSQHVGCHQPGRAAADDRGCEGSLCRAGDAGHAPCLENIAVTY